MKGIKIYIIALAALVMAGCNKDEVTPVDGGDQKQPVQLSLSGMGGVGTGMSSRTGFAGATRMVMRITSKKIDGATSPKAETLVTRTIAKAEAAGTNEYSNVKFDAEQHYTRYWDDAHGRDSQLSIYAVSVPGYDNEAVLPTDIITLPTGQSATQHWVADDGAYTVEWATGTDQSANYLEKDLAFSNNISANGENGRYIYDFEYGKYVPEGYPGDANIGDLGDGMMSFKRDTRGINTGKFDLGHLIFTHALAQVTVKLKAGTGFDLANGEFQFTKAGENVKFHNVNTGGTLNLKDGTWSDQTQQDITRIAEITPVGEGVTRRLVGLIVPGEQIRDGVNTTKMEFEIDHSTYRVSEEMLFEAFKSSTGAVIADGKLTLERGKNYQITITVSKKGIDNLTATLVPWTNVDATNMNVNNAYIKLNLHSPTGTACSDFKLYRLNDPSGEISIDGTWKHYAWYSQYESTTPERVGSTDVWKTNWFFENNKAFYHFRTTNSAVAVNPDAEGDYFNIAADGNDIHWGAPMQSDPTADGAYDFTNNVKSVTAPKGGFSSSLYWGIGATEDQIKITELHIKSQINVVLKTTTGSEAVKLHDGVTPAEVKIVRHAASGTVELGRGLVTPIGTDGATVIPAPGSAPGTYYKTNGVESNAYMLYAVPQTLERGSNAADYVGLEITTPDGNLYKVNRLSDISVNGSSEKITRWLPNHSYTYTFTLTKTGIKQLTATITNWQEVTAEGEDIVIE
ncbi:MAG: fimbrillin family protein [Bacteroidales bacterium]|nr:fimbrillin family protein [Bacteroidales bacterium]